MTCASPRIPLLVIAGPTAAGKTEAALAIASRLKGEIVSADAMQIYRDMDIGTAKPTDEERERVPIHLVDLMPPDAEYSVAAFQRDARRAIREIHGRGRLPILTGGTGLYLRAVLRHFDLPPGPSDRTVRQRLRREVDRLGSAAMHARLAAVDPDAARTILPGDARRIIRALEVHELTGQPISTLQRVDEAPPVDYNVACYVLSAPRPLLFGRIERRVDAMMAAGWLQEVAALRERGLSLSHQSMQAIGYRHLLEHLHGQRGLEDTVRLIKRDTRRYAKRQITWLRRERGYAWLAARDGRQRAAVTEVLLAGARRIMRG